MDLVQTHLLSAVASLRGGDAQEARRRLNVAARYQGLRTHIVPFRLLWEAMTQMEKGQRPEEVGATLSRAELLLRAW
jgi:hypothetical protein